MSKFDVFAMVLAFLLAGVVIVPGAFLIVSRHLLRGGGRHLRAATAGVIADGGPRDFHIRARRAARLLDVAAVAGALEIFTDLEVDPALELELAPDDAPESFTALQETLRGLGVGLAKRRLVITGEPTGPVDDYDPLIDEVARLADHIEASFQVDPCPRCRVRAFRAAAGQLHEGACRACGGRFLPPEAARRLFVEELGLDIAALKDAQTDERILERCPSCQSRMRRAHIDAVEVELCAGCGAAWLDAGELSAVSGGLHRG